MQSPDFVLPSGKPQNKDEISAKLAETFSGIKKACETVDLNQTCLDFEMPGVGHLTGLELVNFTIVHTIRHTHQLKKIRAAIG